MGKHYDNKNDLLKEMKKRKLMADNAISSTFTAYMIVATLTLYEDLGFRNERLQKFLTGFYKRLERYENGSLTLDQMKKTLYDKAGVVVEGPKIQ